MAGDRRPFGRCNPWRPLGYQIGSWGGRLLLRKLGPKPDRQKLIDSALDYVEKQGALGIFLTRWRLTPVGPWANFAAGAIGYPRPRFTRWPVTGEAVWVRLYSGLGTGFAGNIQATCVMAGSVLGIVAGVAVMLGLGWWPAYGQTVRQPDCLAFHLSLNIPGGPGV